MRGVGEMPKTGTFFDIDPDNWKEYVSVPVSSGDGGCRRPTQPEVKKAPQAPTSLDDLDYAPFWQAHLVWLTGTGVVAPRNSIRRWSIAHRWLMRRSSIAMPSVNDFK